MTEQFFASLRILIRLFRLDLKHLLQRITNPIVIAVLLLILVSFALTLGTFHHLASVYAPLHGVSNPKFGLGGYEPLLFYLGIVVVLVFALRLPSYREESINNVVITYREPSNFLLTLSRVLTPTLVVFGCVFVTAFAYQVIASIDVANNPSVLEPFEFQSLVFVFVELFLSMLFWTSLAILITQVLKSAPLGFLGTLVILILQAWISPALPGELGSFTFGYGAANLYVSEIAPSYWEAKHVFYCLSIVGLAFAFIVATSWLHDRTDPAKQSIYKPMIVALTALGVVSQVTVHSFNFKDFNQHQTWLRAYEDATESLEDQASITAIEGSVSIKPGSKLSLNLNYKFVLNNTDAADPSHIGFPDILLAFNPGMTVQSIQCSTVDLPYSHTHGILKVDLASCGTNDDQEYSIDFVASGKPVPHYLVKHIPRADRPNVNPQLVRLMGQKSSIFTSDYVALTPSSHWYPQLLTGSNSSNDSAKTHAPNVSLKIDLAPKSWTVVASGGRLVEEAPNSQDGLRLLSGSFPSVGIIASDFRTSSHSFESIDVNVVVHKRHAKRLERNQLLMDALVGYVSDAITKLDSYGIDYPFNQFTIVEVPATLSLLNHENSVDLGLDSIVMFRESGIPFARLFRLDEWQEDFEQAEADESPMAEFLESQVDFLKSLYWTNPIFNHTYEDAIVESLVSGRINRTDENSDLAELVLETLLFNLLEARNYRFDLDLANSLALASRINLRYMWFHRRGGSMRLDLLNFQDGFMDSNKFWESIEQSFSAHEASEDQTKFPSSQDYLRNQRFRVLKLSETLSDYYEEQTIATTLAHILRKDITNPIDLELITQVAESNDLDITSLVQNTLLNTELAGINFSSARQLEFNLRNENGHRFNTVLHLRNNEDAVGYVSFHVVEVREITEEGRTLRTVANDRLLGPFELQANSSYQLLMNTANLVGNLQGNTYLSRNRGRVEIALTHAHSEDELDAMSATTDAGFSFVSSQWNAQQNEDEVIVDDLDLGFNVPATNYREKSNFWTFGTHLFRHFFPREEGMDNGLPIGQNPQGPWVRVEGLASWGRYRHTFALGDTSKPGVHPISFNSTLSKKGKWKLSYHLPDVIFFLQFQQAKLGVHIMDVNCNEQTWNHEIKPDNWVVGWNEISNFDITSPGDVRVSVSNKSEEPYVVADAIKWTYLD